MIMAFEIPKTEAIGSISRPPISRMQELKLRTWRDLNPTYRRAFLNRYDITDIFREELERKRDSPIPQHTILECNGDTGSGKSEAIMNIAMSWITDSWKKVHICMEASSFNQLASEAKRGDCIIRDEQPMRVGLGSVRENMQMINIGEITRKYRLNLAFVSPSPRYMVLSHYRLITLWMDTENWYNRLAVIDPRREICIGNIDVPIMQNNPLREKYELKKDEFIDATRKGSFAHDLLLRKAHEMIEDIKYEGLKNDSRRKAYVRNRFPMFTSGEIKQIVENVKLIKEGAIE